MDKYYVIDFSDWFNNGSDWFVQRVDYEYSEADYTDNIKDAEWFSSMEEAEDAAQYLIAQDEELPNIIEITVNWNYR